MQSATRISILAAFFFCLSLVGSSVQAQGKKVAFLVGINVYQKPGLTKLRFAEADVLAVAKELRTIGFETTTLLGKQATRQRIESELDRVLAPLGAEDLILVMVAGHGQQLEVIGEDDLPAEDAFYCPYDAQAGDAETLYSLSFLVDDQLNLNAGRRILMVDACRDVPDDVGRGIQGNATIALPEDTAIFFSCRSGQRSFENPTLKHGLFTYAVLEGLRGGAARDGKISWAQLVSFVDWAMASTKLRQHMPSDTPQVPITAGGLSFTILGQGNWGKTPPAPAALRPPTPTVLDERLTNSIGMKFQKLPPGEFIMGSPSDEKGRRPDEPQHRVTITNSTYFSVFEVSQVEYEAVMQVNPSYFSEFGDGAEKLEGALSDQLPVEQVSWKDANEFCRKLSNLPAERRANRRYRLPTEAEWEYAARASSTSRFPFGNRFDPRKANGDGEHADVPGLFLGKTWDIASSQPNAFGLYNVSGNVAEWCSDWFGSDQYSVSTGPNPVGPGIGTERVVRGGSWFDHPQFLRSASRQSNDPAVREPFTGIRVVCELP